MTYFYKFIVLTPRLKKQAGDKGEAQASGLCRSRECTASRTSLREQCCLTTL